jgi:hypothetical protein
MKTLEATSRRIVLLKTAMSTWGHFGMEEVGRPTRYSNSEVGDEWRFFGGAEPVAINAKARRRKDAERVK